MTRRSALDISRGYHRRGWPPVPIPPGSKGPVLPGWQHLDIPYDDLPRYFSDNGVRQNVGVRLGAPAGGLVDIDLDVDEACALGGLLLPATGAIFGRAGKPRSHYLYIATQPALPKSMQLDWPGKAVNGKPVRIVELRSTKLQTVFPGSTWTDADNKRTEEVRWDTDGEPASVSTPVLTRVVQMIAAGVVLLPFWQPGRRDKMALALGGALLRSGWSVEDTARIIGAIASVAGDEEVASRRQTVGQTKEKLDEGCAATGLRTLAEIVGDDVVIRQVRAWLQLGSMGAAGAHDRTQHGAPSGHGKDHANSQSGGSAKLAQEQPAGADWDEPIPLTAGDLPAFPVDALPSSLVEQVRGVAKFTQTPPDLAAMIGLSAIAVPCAKKVRVEVKRGYTEPANVYTATAMIPGSRKTAVFAAMTAPLEEWEEEQARRMEGDIADARTKYDIMEAALKKAKTDAANARPEEREQKTRVATDEARKLAATKIPQAPRLVADDASPEKVASLLHDHDGRLALMSPEGDVFDLMAGRYGNGPNLGVYLKGHAGDTLRVDRIGRPAEYVTQPALTMGLAVQPDVLSGLMAQKGFRGRGLLGRFLYSLPPSLMGARDTAAPPVPAGTTQAYREALRALLNLPFAEDDKGHKAAWTVKLDPAARSRLAAFEKEIEPDLAREGMLGGMTDWGGKLVGAVARITLLLHMAEHAHHTKPWDVRIAPSTVEDAIKIGRYATAHAKVAYAVMGGDAAVEGASQVLAWIENKQIGTFSQRDAQRALRARFERADDVKAALTVLEERGYVREQPQEQRQGAGRHKSPRYDVNPWVRKHPRHANSVNLSILSGGAVDGNGMHAAEEPVEEVRV